MFGLRGYKYRYVIGNNAVLLIILNQGHQKCPPF